MQRGFQFINLFSHERRYVTSVVEGDVKYSGAKHCSDAWNVFGKAEGAENHPSFEGACAEMIVKTNLALNRKQVVAHALLVLSGGLESGARFKQATRQNARVGKPGLGHSRKIKRYIEVDKAARGHF
jgi:hypothetical protein